MKRERGARRKVRVLRSAVPSRSSNEEQGSRRLPTCGRSTSACSIKEYDSIKNCWKRALQDWVSRSSSRELPARRRSHGRFTRLAAKMLDSLLQRFLPHLFFRFFPIYS